MIVNIRLDEKMVKGQLKNQWTSDAMTGKSVILVNDELAADSLKISTLSLTAPAGIKFVYKSVADAIKIMKDPRGANMTFWLVVNNLKDIVRINEEVKVDKVNIAYLLGGKGEKKELAAQAKVTQENEDMIRDLISKGVTVIYQPIPTFPEEDFKKLLGL